MKRILIPSLVLSVIAFGSSVAAPSISGRENIPETLVTMLNAGKEWREYDPSATDVILESSKTIASKLGGIEGECGVRVVNQISENAYNQFSLAFLWRQCVNGRSPSNISSD